MKRLLAILLTLAVLLSLAACGGGDEPDIPVTTEGPAETSADTSTEAPTETTAQLLLDQSVTITDGIRTTVTIHYPASFTYEADYRKGSFLSHTPYMYGGVLQGTDYTVDFGFVKANDYYKTVEEYVKTFSGTDIYEEIEVCGLKAYVRQDMTSRLNVVICLDEERMLNVEIAVPGDGSEAIYRPIWEGDVISAIVENLEITVGEAETETYTTDYGYVSITTTEGWYKGDPNSNFALTLFHRDEGAGCWVDILDLQLGTLQETMEHISSGYPDTTWTEITIGSNTFKYLDCGSVCYLAAETSTGKPFHMEVRNVPLEDVMPMLETIVIH